MSQPSEVTLDDAKNHIRSLELLSGGTDIKDPIGYFIDKIAKMEEILAGFENEMVAFPCNKKIREAAIKWLSEALTYQRAYLARYQEVPFRSTTSSYGMALDNLAKDGVIPMELGRFLTDVINAYLQKDIMLIATNECIQLAKTYLQGGVELDDFGERHYLFNVMLFVPDKDDNSGSFFVLVKKYPGGKLKYLKDV